MNDKKRILVAEDAMYVLEILRFSLEAEGFEVVTTASGADAVTMAPVEQFDLIVLDVYLPGLDGYDACRQIKADPRTRDIPVILLTARGTPGDLQLCFDAGATDSLSKPFSPRRLIARIKEILGEVEARSRAGGRGA